MLLWHQTKCCKRRDYINIFGLVNQPLLFVTHTYMYTHVRVNAQKTHRRTHKLKHTPAHTHTHTQAQTRLYTHTNTHIQIHTHSHAHGYSLVNVVVVFVVGCISQKNTEPRTKREKHLCSCVYPHLKSNFNIKRQLYHYYLVKLIYFTFSWYESKLNLINEFTGRREY